MNYFSTFMSNRTLKMDIIRLNSVSTTPLNIAAVKPNVLAILEAYHIAITVPKVAKNSFKPIANAL